MSGRPGKRSADLGWLLACLLFWAAPVAAGDTARVPVEGMVTLVDLGADKCIPCKMMAPILEKLKKTYEGKAAIVFVDVWQDRDQAQRFEVQAVPTQVFYDRQGKEVHRHVGFMSEAEIVDQLKKMGVD